MGYIWGSYLNIPKAIFDLLKGDYRDTGGPSPRRCKDESKNCQRFTQKVLHSRKLTWKPKKSPIKTTVPLKGDPMGFHVSLGECKVGVPAPCCLAISFARLSVLSPKGPRTQIVGF